VDCIRCYMTTRTRVRITEVAWTALSACPDPSPKHEASLLSTAVVQKWNEVNKF
jgi:hypothetical protein